MEQTDHEQEPLEELELGVWLALDIRNGFLGASSVDFNTKKIHLIEDNVDGANCVEIIKTIILQVSPTKIFTPSLFSENIHTMLRSAMVERHYDIEIVKQIDYDFQLGLNVLETLGNSSAFWLISSSLDMMITV